MKKKYFSELFSVILIVFILAGSVISAQATAQGQAGLPALVPTEEGGDDPQGSTSGFADLDAPVLSADGNTLFNAVPLRVLVVDPNPEMQGLRFPLEPDLAAAVADTRSTRTTFSITYSTTTLLNYNCQYFPTAARTAIEAAAAIWANTVQSTVPIKIEACWSENLPSGVLGMTGGQPLHMNFPGAPKAGTWYQSSLADSLRGIDNVPGDNNADMKIVYNSTVPWFYGTNGQTPSGQFDLVTVAAHEIAHGLNFSGSAGYLSGLGSYKILDAPVIYDTFMEDLTGNPLSSFNSSQALGNLFTSNNLWWDGTNANAANGRSRVKMYAPSPWVDGSSYSHLDYETYKAPSSNSLMVYSIASGSSQHNPGNVTKGILKDMGWTVAYSPPTLVYLPLIRSGGTVAPPVYPLLNGDFEAGRDGSWMEYSVDGWDLIGDFGNAHSGNWLAYFGYIEQNDNDDRLSQHVTITAAQPYLHFWFLINSTDDWCGYDFAYVKVNGITVGTIDLCTDNNTQNWTPAVVNLEAYAGSNVTLMFHVTTDFIFPSEFYLDTVSLSSSSSLQAMSAESLEILPDFSADKR